MNVPGQRVLVMGKCSGIGLAIAQTLRAGGARLVLTARRPSLRKAAAKIVVRDKVAA